MEYPSAPCNTVFTGGLLREPNNNLVCREDLIRVVVVCSFVHPCSPQFLKIVTLCDWVNGWGSCGVGTRLRECILVLYRSSKVDIYKILILKKIPTAVLETATSRLEGGRSIQLSYAGFVSATGNEPATNRYLS